MPAPTTTPTAGAATITATGEGNGVLVAISSKIANPHLIVGFSGTFTSAVVAVKGRLLGLTTYFPVLGKRRGTGAPVTNSASISLTDSTAEAIEFDLTGCDYAEIYCVSGTPTDLDVEVRVAPADPTDAPIVLVNQSSANTITSTSATALAVGANGTTNPVLTVDANTASVATGVKVTGAAAAGGVAVTATSSGTNESIAYNAKGSGVLSLGDTSTGGVGLNRGALKALQVGLTLTALGTVQSSTPTAAQLLGGFLTQTGSTGAGAITLPTGTALSTACPRTPATGDSFECIFANLGGGQTLTVTGATGTTVVSGGAIATAKSAVLKFICTGSNSWSIAVVGG